MTRGLARLHRLPGSSMVIWRHFPVGTSGCQVFIHGKTSQVLARARHYQQINLMKTRRDPLNICSREHTHLRDNLSGHVNWWFKWPFERRRCTDVALDLVCIFRYFEANSNQLLDIRQSFDACSGTGVRLAHSASSVELVDREHSPQFRPG